MSFGLSKPPQTIEGASHAPVCQRCIRWPERAPPLGLDDREGFLVFKHGRVKVAL